MKNEADFNNDGSPEKVGPVEDNNNGGVAQARAVGEIPPPQREERNPAPPINVAPIVANVVFAAAPPLARELKKEAKPEAPKNNGNKGKPPAKIGAKGGDQRPQARKEKPKTRCDVYIAPEFRDRLSVADVEKDLQYIVDKADAKAEAAAQAAPKKEKPMVNKVILEKQEAIPENANPPRGAGPPKEKQEILAVQAQAAMCPAGNAEIVIDVEAPRAKESDVGVQIARKSPEKLKQKSESKKKVVTDVVNLLKFPGKTISGQCRVVPMQLDKVEERLRILATFPRHSYFGVVIQACPHGDLVYSFAQAMIIDPLALFQALDQGVMPHTWQTRVEYLSQMFNVKCIIWDENGVIYHTADRFTCIINFILVEEKFYWCMDLEVNDILDLIRVGKGRDVSVANGYLRVLTEEDRLSIGGKSFPSIPKTYAKRLLTGPVKVNEDQAEPANSGKNPPVASLRRRHAQPIDEPEYDDPFEPERVEEIFSRNFSVDVPLIKETYWDFRRDFHRVVDYFQRPVECADLGDLIIPRRGGGTYVECPWFLVLMWVILVALLSAWLGLTKLLILSLLSITWIAAPVWRYLYTLCFGGSPKYVLSSTTLRLMDNWKMVRRIMWNKQDKRMKRMMLGDDAEDPELAYVKHTIRSPYKLPRIMRRFFRSLSILVLFVTTGQWKLKDKSYVDHWDPGEYFPFLVKYEEVSVEKVISLRIAADACALINIDPMLTRQQRAEVVTRSVDRMAHVGLDRSFPVFANQNVLVNTREFVLQMAHAFEVKFRSEHQQIFH